MGQGRLKSTGRQNAGAASQDQIEAKIILQPLDPLTDGGGGKAENLGGSGQRTGPHGKFQRLKRDVGNLLLLYRFSFLTQRNYRLFIARIGAKSLQ